MGELWRTLTRSVNEPLIAYIICMLVGIKQALLVVLPGVDLSGMEWSLPASFGVALLVAVGEVIRRRRRAFYIVAVGIAFIALVPSLVWFLCRR